MKKIRILTLITSISIAITACTGNTADVVQTEAASAPVNTVSTEVVTSTVEATIISNEVDYDSEDLTPIELNAEGATILQLNSDSVTVTGTGAVADGSRVTISSAGVYQLSGILTDGQIIIDTQDENDVFLILAGVDITSRSSSPIYIVRAPKVILTLAAGFENIVTDNESYTNLDGSGEPNAAIFSHEDLTINGDGSLTVNANYNNGIASKDDLKITGGSITVNAVNDGIKGKDLLAILDGNLTVNAGADGLQSTNADDVERGFISISGGTLTINAGLDGIQSAADLEIIDGDFTIITGGGSGNSSTTGGGIWGPGSEGNTNTTLESAKGLKAASNLTVSGGTLNIDSADDSIHTNANVFINGGNIRMSSGDDGIHADESLTINNGEINLTQSYEGLESAIITINGGTIHIVSSDDGINAGGGADSSSTGGRPGQNDFTRSGDYFVTVNGGYLYVDAGGDGIDTNGSFAMTDGLVLVNGPTMNNNGPLDYMGTFTLSGGFLVAVGSSGMAQAPSTDSTQYSVIQSLSSVQTAGTMVHIETTSGENILTFLPIKSYQSVLLSSPDLKNGESYVLYLGGSSTGTAVDGLITDGEYTPGTQITSFTISSIVTGESAGGGRRGH